MKIIFYVYLQINRVIWSGRKGLQRFCHVQWVSHLCFHVKVVLMRSVYRALHNMCGVFNCSWWRNVQIRLVKEFLGKGERINWISREIFQKLTWAITEPDIYHSYIFFKIVKIVLCAVDQTEMRHGKLYESKTACLFLFWDSVEGFLNLLALKDIFCCCTTPRYVRGVNRRAIFPWIVSIDPLAP